MRLTTTALAVVLSVSWNRGVASSIVPHLRHNNDSKQQDDDTAAAAAAACNAATSKEACWATTDTASGGSCVWCVAGAIPSECVSASQADALPPAVFTCESPNADQQYRTIKPNVNSKSNSRQGLIADYFFDVEGMSDDRDGETVVTASDTDATTKSISLTTNHHDAGDDALCDGSSKSISGYMDIKGSEYDKNGEDKHLFFWMFEKRGSVDPDTPFIVWLTGGPGCSSTLALLTENGPCSVNSNGMGTSVNPNSWTESANVLWIDQPAGVGFSYGSETDYNEKMVSEDAYYFLQAFFQTYPAYQTNPLFIVGESYAGHYVPAIAHRVWRGNKAAKDKTIQLNLAGFSIGNGLTDPERQYPWYPEMVYNNSHGIKVVNEATYETMKKVVPKCTALINECNAGDGTINEFACQSAFLVCNMGLTSPYQMTGLNPYDIRIKCAKPPLCYDFSNVQTWLNRQSTKDALGVDPDHSHNWRSCNFGINMKFHTDWMKTFAPFVSDLLNAGVPALMYAGDVDFICNYLGNRAWTLALDWKGKEDFNAAAEHDWKGNGLARTTKGFTFLQVYDAGHMVPADQPKVSLDMITQFLNGESF